MSRAARSRGLTPGPGRRGLVLAGRVEVERERVDAVALAGRRGPVREDVAEVGVARPAADLDPPHPVRVVLLQLDRVLGDRLEEARPARPRLELGMRAEQLRSARAAAV